MFQNYDSEDESMPGLGEYEDNDDSSVDSSNDEKEDNREMPRLRKDDDDDDSSVDSDKDDSGPKSGL